MPFSAVITSTYEMWVLLSMTSNLNLYITFIDDQLIVIIRLTGSHLSFLYTLSFPVPVQCHVCTAHYHPCVDPTDYCIISSYLASMRFANSNKLGSICALVKRWYYTDRN